jgi:hypothetical protein
MKKTKLQIIEETIETYRSVPSKRSIEEATRNCMYNGPDGKQCAADRCFNPDVIKLSDEGESIVNLIQEYGDETLFKPEYQGHEESLWYRIQIFHDTDENFTETGLSEEGKIIANKLRNKYRR